METRSRFFWCGRQLIGSTIEFPPPIRPPSTSRVVKRRARGGRLTEAVGFFERALEFDPHHEGACRDALDRRAPTGG